MKCKVNQLGIEAHTVIFGFVNLVGEDDGEDVGGGFEIFEVGGEGLSDEVGGGVDGVASAGYGDKLQA